MAEYEKQTNLYERILQELTEIKSKRDNQFPIKPKRIGRRVMFERAELEAYISSLNSVK